MRRPRVTQRTVRAAIVLAAIAALAPVCRAQTAAQQAALASLIPVQAGATIDRDSVTVGDVVKLTVRVRAPLGATVNFPTGTDTAGPVQSLEPPRVTNGADSASAADRIAVYRVVPWDVGPLAIRLGEVLVQTDDGERRIAAPLPSLFVRSVLPADSALRVPRPARPLLPVPAVLPWWWWIAALLGAVTLMLAIWWWRRRRGRARGPVGDPWADAERGFERVERLGLVAAGEAGRHAVLMTDVLRRYLVARLEAASLAQTSGELLRALRGAPTVSHDRLERLLARVDEVKFAAAPIAGDEARAIGAEARTVAREEHERAQAIAAADAARAQAAGERKAAA